MTTSVDLMTDNQRATARRSKMTMLGVLSVSFLVFLLIGYLLMGVERRRVELPVLGKVPSNLAFTERNGSKVTLGDLKGNIWVADVIFTRCKSVCILMSTTMRDLQKSLYKAKNVKLVSFTIDPEYDKPEVLAQYADRYNADKSQWLFMNSDLGTVKELFKNLKLTAVNETQNPDEITHSSRLVLIDTEGQIRGYYNIEQDTEAQQKLIVDIGELIKQQTEAR